MGTRRLCFFLMSLALAVPVHASVIEPHLGLQFVEQPNRRTLIVDLCAPGIELRATRYEEKKQTTESWGNALGLQAAVNGDFFDFPAATLVLGRAMGDWEWWPWGTAWVDEQSRPYWQMGPEWAELVEYGFDEPSWGTRDIVGAHNTLMSEGIVLAPWVSDQPLLNGAHRRTAYGLSATRRKMFWTVVHAPVTAVQLVNHMVADALEAGAPAPHWIANQDGGGSAQIWVENLGFVLPSTRKVANHLGVFAKGFGESAYNCAAVPWEATFVESTFPLTVPGLWSLGSVQLKWGETTSGTITFTNAGSSPWTPGVTKLAPTPMDEPHPLASSAWLSPTRIGSVTSVIESGKDHVFTLAIHGGSPGSHTLSLGLVEEGVAWFHDEALAGGPPLGAISIEVIVSDEPFCTSDCNQKECGNDGCGGSCGSCPPSSACDGTLCACIPVCGASVCGADGCGGICGTCGTNELCTGGECACAGSCAGKSCGSDGCGGTCGDCPFDTTCQGDQCVCSPICGSKVCGTNGCGGSCGECDEATSCVDGSCVCVPDCAGVACGDDGCGGSCGPCPEPDAGEESDAPHVEEPDVETDPDPLEDAGTDVPIPADSTTDEVDTSPLPSDDTLPAPSDDTMRPPPPEDFERGPETGDVTSNSGAGFRGGTLGGAVPHSSNGQDPGCRQTQTTSPSLPAAFLLGGLLLGMTRRRVGRTI